MLIFSGQSSWKAVASLFGSSWRLRISLAVWSLRGIRDRPRQQKAANDEPALGCLCQTRRIVICMLRVPRRAKTRFRWKHGLVDLHRKSWVAPCCVNYGLDLTRLLAQPPRRLGNGNDLYRLGSLTPLPSVSVPRRGRRAAIAAGLTPRPSLTAETQDRSPLRPN